MANTPLDMPVIISQLPHLQPLVNAEQAKNEVGTNAFAALVDRQVREKEERVQGVAKQQAAEAVDRDGGRGQEPQHHAQGRRPGQEKEDPQATTSNASPWAGNIINIKI